MVRTIKTICKRLVPVLILASVCSAFVGCGDKTVDTPKPVGSIDDQIKAAQNNPNLSPSAKAQIVGQLTMEKNRLSAAPSTN
jgi:hypothetical protein